LSHTHDKGLERKTTFISRARIATPEAAKSNGMQKATEGSPPSDLDRASSWSEDMQGLGHLDPQKSILLRFECMSAAELKVGVAILLTISMSTTNFSVDAQICKDIGSKKGLDCSLSFWRCTLCSSSEWLH
jgi:hypothetical protein